MMENRSFDHFLGRLPKANGRQAGLTYYDKLNQPHATLHLTSPQNCNYEDPDHSYSGGHVQYDNGACDGWLKAGTNDVFPIGYYLASDLAFLSQAASE
jgi:phospholipase C